MIQKKKKVLFVTYDGLTDPLGRSQIIPYLVGLSFESFEITILSCEKKVNFKQKKDVVEKILHLSNIQWKKRWYTKKPAILSTYWDLTKMRLAAKWLHKRNRYDIIHCRSLLSFLIAEKLQGLSTKLLFDIRGFWVDERVEGGLWNINKLHYQFLFSYFKKQEVGFFKKADHIITLTHKAKSYISEHYLNAKTSSISVVPCSVDMNIFNSQKFTQSYLNTEKLKLGIEKEDFVLGYVGSLGTRYMLSEMLDFFVQLKKIKENSKFFFVSNSPKTEIMQMAFEKDIESSVIYLNSDFSQVPKYIMLFDMGIYFILPGFSNLAVSPSKQAEILAMGIPIVSNSGIGDSNEILQENKCGYCIEGFSDDEYKKAIQSILDLKSSPEHITAVANKYFSLPLAIEKYKKVYIELCEKS